MIIFIATLIFLLIFVGIYIWTINQDAGLAGFIIGFVAIIGFLLDISAYLTFWIIYLAIK